MKDSDISLSAEEAKFLRDKILSNIGGSVFAKALENNIKIPSRCQEGILIIL